VILGHSAARLAGTVASGVVGVLVVDAVKSRVGRSALRRSAVTVTTWGLRSRNGVEAAAEHLRLATGDVVAEARERIGEQAPPPDVADAHDHQH
jgi:hypothetical protein